MIESTHVYLGDPMSLIRVTGAGVGVMYRRRYGSYVLEDCVVGGAVRLCTGGGYVQEHRKSYLQEHRVH